MSLVEEAMEKSYRIQKTANPDGYGSVNAEFEVGAEILVAYAFNNSSENNAAAAQGVKSRYTLYTHKADVLKFPDIVKRDSDGKYFRIISDGSDNHTPATAALDLRAAEAEEWNITQNEQAASI